MKILGVDWSLTCPAWCLVTTTGATHWGLRMERKRPAAFVDPRVEWVVQNETTDWDRKWQHAQWLTSVVTLHKPDVFWIEQFAFNANGRITELAESVGVMLACLYQKFPTMQIHRVAPTAAKKFASGSGRADKDIMWDAFVKTHPDAASWPSEISPKAAKINSPLGDLADAWAVGAYGYHWVTR